MRLLIKNIKKLLQTRENNCNVQTINGIDMKNLPSISNAYLIINNNLIEKFGSISDLDANQNFDKTIDAQQGIVMPAWVDSHTHLVFAATRESEFVDRINGLSYAEIAEKGGGILNSARKMQDISESELFDLSLQRLESAIAMGTGAIEIKSGYGLNTATELKMLKVIARLKNEKRIPIKASFLAAHAYPLDFKTNHQGYLNLVINEMLPIVASEGLADYIDVFCETGFFSVDETSQILEAAAKFNLKPKIHANQLNNSGGVQVGVKYKAISVDHLETLGIDEINCLKNSTTIPTLLPGAAFFLGMHYQPARMLIDADLPVCLASDYNPGSCPSANMNFITSLACTQMKMTPQEAINACTINAAAALEMSHNIGQIKEGFKANIIISKPIVSEDVIPYSFGENLISQVIVSN
jgi:imidazolonepropionase